MKATVILAMIPLGLATAFLPRWPDPQPAKAETFKQRFEPVHPMHTFEERWQPVEALLEAQRSPPVDLLAPKVVRTIRITKDAVAPPQTDNSDIVDNIMSNVVGSRGDLADMKRAPVLRPKPRPIRVADICARHGMHRVDYGRTWRCRK
jgi:hypothetical protein